MVLNSQAHCIVIEAYTKIQLFTIVEETNTYYPMIQGGQGYGSRYTQTVSKACLLVLVIYWENVINSFNLLSLLDRLVIQERLVQFLSLSPPDSVRF